MNDLSKIQKPVGYDKHGLATREINFSMASDQLIGSLIRGLVASKPRGRFLDLGTGTGLSLSWILDGMDEAAQVVSLDNDQNLIHIARSFFGDDPRVELLCTDGELWIQSYDGQPFDLIFADTWAGKYSKLVQTLKLVNQGGFYLIDDMLAQCNWPKNHHIKAKELIATLDQQQDFHITKMSWSTGIILLTRKYQ